MQSAWLDVLVKINEDILFLDTDMMSGKKKEKLLNYIKVLEEARNKVVSSNNPKLECIYKEYYYDLFVNKAASKLIIKDQKESLDKWINYFLWDEKGKNYSAIEMYWVLEGLSKLGKYDKKNNKYLKRDKKTLYPFALLDKKALEETIALLNDYLENKTGPSELKDALGQANFKRLYEYSLNKKKSNQTVTNTTEGIWKKYDQGSDYNILKEDIINYDTGWCTALRGSYAKEYLALGDHYIYYTLDNNGEYKIPRIAIRMKQNDILEIRGIEANQDIEPELLPILEDKLNNLVAYNKDIFYKKIHDTRLLNNIYNKHVNNEELTKEELEFLYEKNNNISSFCLDDNPILNWLLLRRDERKDLAVAYDLDVSKIAISMNECNNNTVLCNDDFDGRIMGTDYPNLKIITGNAKFLGVEKVTNLNNLEYIGGTVLFPDLKTANNLSSLTQIGSSAFFDSLTDSKGLENLKYIRKTAFFPSLQNARGLTNLRYIGHDACFDNLLDLTGLENLDFIGGKTVFNPLINKVNEILKYPKK